MTNVQLNVGRDIFINIQANKILDYAKNVTEIVNLKPVTGNLNIIVQIVDKF